MKIIRIEKRPEGKDFEEWVLESNRKIGLPDDAWEFTYTGPWEFVWVGKCLYKRVSVQGMFYIVYDYMEGTPPQVMCECEGTSFWLWYGGYELNAVCVECGKEETVYDG